MCGRERRKWKRVNRSRQGGTEIDNSSETKSRIEWEAFESERYERKKLKDPSITT